MMMMIRNTMHTEQDRDTEREKELANSVCALNRYEAAKKSPTQRVKDPKILLNDNNFIITL